jgi:DNA polymerase III alpha subunit
MCRDPLTDHVPVWRRDADGAIITQFDMGAVESLGLLKMDFLGLRNLTVLDDCLAHIESNRGETIVLETSRSMTRRPTSCSAGATPWACSSSTVARCARCCAR